MFDSKIFKNIERNRELEAVIFADMEKNAGVFKPHIHWRSVDDKFRSSTEQSLSSMLDDYIGSEGLKQINYHQKKLYDELFKYLDNLELSKYLNSDSISADYGSVMDINLINVFIPSEEKQNLKICEVGGGYGRLAKIFTDYYKKSVKYVLVDSVPVSVMFSYQYLTSVCDPDIKIGFYYNGDEFDLDKYDIYIVPSWHFERINKNEYDVAINIESMQEMNYDEIKRFLTIFNNCIKTDGIIYLSNSKEYVYKGVWPYPDNWDCLFRNNTPRSWTRKHPAEIFRKSSGSFRNKEKLFDFYSDIEKLFEMTFDGNSTQYPSRKELEDKFLELENNSNNLYKLIEEKEKLIEEKEKECNTIYQSKSWKIVETIRNIKLRVLGK